MLKGSDTIAITENGIGFLKAKKPFSCNKNLCNILSMSVIYAILASLINGRASAMGRIEGQIKRFFKNVSPDNIRYHIMWLLKKDMIRMKGGE